jgi:hypothetical protein
MPRKIDLDQLAWSLVTATLRKRSLTRAALFKHFRAMISDRKIALKARMIKDVARIYARRTQA